MTQQSDHTPTPKLALDLSKFHSRHEHGDITVYVTWTQHNRRPALVLVPTFVPMHHERITPCIIPLDMAYMWDEHAGNGAHCARTTQMFVANLGGNPMNPRLCFKVTDLIREHLGDLLTCPPMRDMDQVEVAFATLKDTETGEILSQTGITEDV
jgi:hypothetical protein